MTDAPRYTCTQHKMRKIVRVHRGLVFSDFVCIRIYISYIYVYIYTRYRSIVIVLLHMHNI